MPKLRNMRAVRLAAATLSLSAAVEASSEPTLRYQVASTVSPEAARDLTAIYAASSRRPSLSAPTSLKEWDQQREMLDKLMIPVSDATVAKLGASVQDDRLGNVPIIRVRPAGYKPNGRLLIYLHGGDYTFFSAHSRLGPAALVAAATGDEVVSIDYTVAPRGNWQIVTDQIIAVWKALLVDGGVPERIGMFGDSAGGGMAAGAVLKMRDQKLPLPGALYLMSPSCDVTQAGDSYLTLSSFDPVLDPESSARGARAYAEPQDQKNPYVSAVYGDYSKPYPPTLIQGGTREMLLSNFVREYQAIRAGGHEAVLDIYEGMPHVFQGSVPNTPEARTALARAAAFFREHLR